MKQQPIARQPVTSSQLVSVGHDPESNTLAIEFKGGSVYHYANVSAEDHKALVNAPSVGSHFYRNIKPNVGKFPFSKMAEPSASVPVTQPDK